MSPGTEVGPKAPGLAADKAPELSLSCDRPGQERRSLAPALRTGKANSMSPHIGPACRVRPFARPSHRSRSPSRPPQRPARRHTRPTSAKTTPSKITTSRTCGASTCPRPTSPSTDFSTPQPPGCALRRRDRGRRAVHVAPISRPPNFTGADLTRADLSSANLKEAILANAMLWDATLAGSQLKDADFSRRAPARRGPLERRRTATSPTSTGAYFDADTLLAPAIDDSVMYSWSASARPTRACTGSTRTATATATPATGVGPAARARQPRRCSRASRCSRRSRGDAASAL